jgi:hypothetical protein
MPQNPAQRLPKPPIRCLALPCNQNAPTILAKLPHGTTIPSTIFNELLPPKSGARLRKTLPSSASVPMPKASMHKYDRLPARKYDVGRSWETLVVLKAAITHLPQAVNDSLFGRCGFPPHGTHNPASLLFANDIRRELQNHFLAFRILSR